LEKIHHKAKALQKRSPANKIQPVGVTVISKFLPCVGVTLKMIAASHLMISIWVLSGPDWARTSDPALIKRML
jgi:hypothetical protein